MRSTALLRLLLLTGLVPSFAAGQDRSDAVRRVDRQLREFEDASRYRIPEDGAAADRLLVDYGASLQFLVLSLDDEFSHSHLLRRYEARTYLRLELDHAHRFYTRLRFQWDDWRGNDSFDRLNDEFQNPISERLWYEYDLRSDIEAHTGVSPNYNVNMRLGKQYAQWGAGLTLSGPLEAALLDLEWHDIGLTAIGGWTAASDTVDFDGSRPRFDTHTSRAYYGAMLEYRGNLTFQPYLYSLGENDRNGPERTVFFGPMNNPIPTKFDYDSTYWGAGFRGTSGAALSYRLEAVYQRGRALSSPVNLAGAAVPQTREDIEAGAGLLGLTYLLRDTSATRFNLTAAAGTGDDDRIDSSNTLGGNRSGTDDRAFNSLGFVDTGLALTPSLSNLLMLQLGVNTAPFHDERSALEYLRIGVNGFLFRKLDSDAPLNLLTKDKPFVGSELDFSVDWNVLSDLSLNMRAGVFFPGSAMPSGEDDPRLMFLFGVTYAF